MKVELDLTPPEVSLLQEDLDHCWRTSINHLVSSVEATVKNPTGEWAKHAPTLADKVETGRMLLLKIERAVAPAPAEDQPDENPTVTVQFEVSMYVTVDLVTNLPVRTVVETPNVSSMSEHLTDCVRYGPDVEGSVHLPARWGRPATDEESAEAIKILDDNCWPAPELVS